jgi:DNA-binding response OmpR family regulator
MTRRELGVPAAKQLVYIVEDESDIARLVKHHLEAAGFETRCFGSGATVVSEAMKEVPALFILDIMIPGTDGLDLCRQIRQNGTLSRVPIMFLTARANESDRVRGLELGGDDYIVKPFSPRELVARARAVLRRSDQASPPQVLKVGNLEIDSTAMRVRVDGREVATTVREFRLLHYLVRNTGRVFTRDQLLDAVWSETSYVTPRSIDVYIRRIREKIEPQPEQPRYLKTVHGAGYRFEAPR